VSRIINPDSAGKQRTQLTKTIVLAVRELARQSNPGPESLDLAAFIALSLQTISSGIEASVNAWEKRGYWVKADKFRLAWMWTSELAEKMKAAVLSNNWAAVAALSAQIAQKLNKVEVSDHHRQGKPWVGSFKHLVE
jgi:hypothetical protein